MNPELIVTFNSDVCLDAFVFMFLHNLFWDLVVLYTVLSDTLYACKTVYWGEAFSKTTVTLVLSMFGRCDFCRVRPCTWINTLC